MPESENGNGVYRNGTSTQSSEQQRLRDHILRCTTVSPDSAAVAAVLAFLDDPAMQSVNGTTTLPVTYATLKSRGRTLAKIFTSICRWLLVDAPILILVGLYLSTIVMTHVYDEFLSPQMDLMLYDYDRKESEATYYNRVCDADDISTHNVDDLVMPRNATAHEAMEHILKHGVSLYPDVLSPKTTEKLRSFIVEANKKEANYYVIGQEHRFTFGLRVDHDPSVAQALHEIATHPTLVPAIEAIAGPNPAIIELSPITSEYGADEQWWHQDTLPQGSTFKHVRSFFPSYSIFIPLQDTSAALGATQICPGSHVCDGNDDMCEAGGMLVSGPRDNWPGGTAALMNQHLHHRGTAHRLRGGPDRVLLVMTVAPRPNTGKQAVETRLLSQGGSYSLHHLQWGHTLNDFRDVRSAMRQPWRSLRSLGICKSTNADWGWDWITTSSMRISNDDNGFHQDQLDELMNEEGGLWFLPMFLHGTADDGWRRFLTETLANCKEFMYRLTCIGVALHFGITLLWHAFVRRQRLNTTVRRWTLRMTCICGFLAFLSWATVDQVSRTPWATHIRQGKSYNLGLGKDEPTDVLPATLPNRADVLIDTKYDSKRLWSYNYILDYAHPGNMKLRKMAIGNAGHYTAWPDDVKKLLIDDMITLVGQRQGRFLAPNEVGKWSHAPLQRTRAFCHEELMKLANPFVGQVLREISYLRSELKFGYWRATALSRRVSDGLRALQDTMIDPPRWSQADGSLSLQPTFTVTTSLRLLRPGSRHLTQLRRRVPFPVQPTVAEPFLGAWLQEGDTVEGKYECDYAEWYKGTIGSISMDTAQYDIVHEDGYVDEALPRWCVRPFEPYAVGEVIGLRVDGEEYIGGQIVRVYPDGRCDVETELGIHKSITAADIQRRV